MPGMKICPARPKKGLKISFIIISVTNLNCLFLSERIRKSVFAILKLFSTWREFPQLKKLSQNLPRKAPNRSVCSAFLQKNVQLRKLDIEVSRSDVKKRETMKRVAPPPPRTPATVSRVVSFRETLRSLDEVQEGFS